MFSVIRQLGTPLRYLLIRDGEKLKIDLIVPTAMATISVVTLWALGAPILRTGLVFHVNEMLEPLVGFFVAALAAVSTFGDGAANQAVIGAQLRGRSLARRQFLAYLFGYLTFAGFVLYLVGVAGQLAAGHLTAVATRFPAAWFVAVAAYAFLCWHVVAVTMLGLYYLVDRIYRADPEVLGPSPSQPKESEDE